MDELDLTDAEKEATYQEIKDYVQEHRGLKVSSLYIAQVKQKRGIIERENYNKPKSEGVRAPVDLSALRRPERKPLNNPNAHRIKKKRSRRR